MDEVTVREVFVMIIIMPIPSQFRIFMTYVTAYNARRDACHDLLAYNVLITTVTSQG